MDPAENNSFRTLAKQLGIPHDTPFVRIPEISEALLDEVRLSYDREPFEKWLATYHLARDCEPRDLYPEWRFNHQVEPDQRSGFSTAGRNSFLCVYAKLKHEGLWEEVKTVRWVGESGEITFFPRRGSPALQALLLERGYGDWWRAGQDSPWGVRSRFRGAQLHFRGFNSETSPDNVHIDLHNPGDPAPTAGESQAVTSGFLQELPDAIAHFVEDLHNRHQSHTYQHLRAALAEQGIPLLPLVP